MEAERADRQAVDRTWVHQAIQRIEADVNRSADTHLLRVPLPALPGIDVYLKDESTHPTGSLKHRLARSLFLYGLCNGWIGPGTTIVEASSGSTAVSEAYFARLLGLPFIAVMPRGTSPEKIDHIRFHGGTCHFVEHPGEIYTVSAGLAAATGGHFMDQFTYAERATDWRGNNNIAVSMFEQLAAEPYPEPTWIVCGAGTGGTSATIGRYIRYRRRGTRLCLADPVASIFHRAVADRAAACPPGPPSLIEGIGRQRLEPSFIPELVDRAIAVPDAASIAAARVLSAWIGRGCGGSTGTNMWAVARLAGEMAAQGRRGSIVTLLCDNAERYRSTCFNGAWIAANNLEIAPAEQAMERFLRDGVAIPDDRA